MPNRDINEATREELAEIPQMGSARAETIVHYRDQHGDFTDMKQLAQVPGISETMAEQIGEYFSIQTSQSDSAERDDERDEIQDGDSDSEADKAGGNDRQPRRTTARRATSSSTGRSSAKA